MLERRPSLIRDSCATRDRGHTGEIWASLASPRVQWLVRPAPEAKHCQRGSSWGFQDHQYLGRLGDAGYPKGEIEVITSGGQAKSEHSLYRYENGQHAITIFPLTSTPDRNDDLWTKWYIDEHLPDLVNSKTSTRAAFYRETHDFALATKVPHPRKFLALYQTDFEEPLKSKNYLDGVRHSSGMWPQSKQTSEVGDFDARNYKLIQEYDPNKTGDSAPPFLLTVEMEPTEQNEGDFDDWYRQEHLELLSKLPGYRRSLRYVIGPKTPITQGEPPKYLAIHEIDNPRAFDGKEAEAANTTKWTVKHINEAKSFTPRMWQRVTAEGF